MGQGPLSDCVALLVGAGRGIGAASARALAGLGARVHLVARSEKDIAALCEAITTAGGEAHFSAADIADETAPEACVRACVEGFGRLDVVLNFAAASGPLGRPLWQLSAEDWARTQAVNLAGPFHLARAALPVMIDQGDGRLIFASSPFGDNVTRGIGAYGASRAGLNYLCMQLANELHNSGVASCLVYPGITDTPGLKDFRAAFGQSRQAGALGLGRRPAESADTMASLFAWLCLQPAESINGYVFAWNDSNVRRAVAEFQRQMSAAGE